MPEPSPASPSPPASPSSPSSPPPPPSSPPPVCASTTITGLPRDRFASREELLAYVQEFSLSQGYAVVIRKSNVPRGQVWLRCDLGGTYKSSTEPATGKRKRKTSSRLQNCPFQLYGRRLPDSSWVLKMLNNQHNHDLATEKTELETHPIARRLNTAQKRLVVELTDSGLRPAVIVDRMRARFPDRLVKVQDIYNARNYIRRERLAGRVPFPEITGEVDSAEDRPEVDNTSRSLPEGLSTETVQAQAILAIAAASLTTWSDQKRASFVQELKRLVTRYTSDQEPSNDHSANSLEENTETLALESTSPPPPPPSV
ncbi:hypothetical protein Poli38472_013235 [Pythium oligandrum]|uniref:FAR1 domain-containing protein n=1 Tax=Pythium oligandrum TaxID=41045 RepID=A0A8K1C2M4_PYTOL|nr:hypothetical protein Poli38472_013235 [Pythium oligandrum]|eukprot:TMW55344.1 hypothetical protein Poli38472_013235 [Pythium oligandrum]